MTQKHYFLIQKTVRGMRLRTRLALKSVVVTADDFAQAHRFLTEDFPGWEVSMYWPVLPDWKPFPGIRYDYINRQWRD